MNYLFDARIDLSNSISSNIIEQSNLFDLIDKALSEYIQFLESMFGKTDSKLSRDLALKDIIIKYYGINTKSYTKEEIAILTDKSPERIRQLLHQFHSFMFNLITDKDQHFKINPLISKKVTEFEKILHQNRIMSLENFISIFLKTHNIYVASDKFYLITLFFDIFSIKQRPPTIYHILKNNTFIFFDKEIIIDDFFKMACLIFYYLEKNVLSNEIDDIIIDVKRKMKNVDVELISIACNQIREIEIISAPPAKTKYQLKLFALSNARDMIYRLLSIKGVYVKLAELVKEVNYILIQSKADKKITSSVGVQLPRDERFTSQGKTGYWGLTEWNGNSDTIFDLISSTLIHFNKPMTKKDIFSYILKARPNIPQRSLDTIMYDKTRFIKLIDNTFILKEWKSLYRAKIANVEKQNVYVKENPIKEQIKQQAISLIQKNNFEKIYLNTIINALVSKYGFIKASIYSVISDNDEFVKFRDKDNKVFVSLTADLQTVVKQNQTNTSVFVSYSWDSAEHQDKVISFVDFLRNNGFNADIDKKIMQDETAIDFNKLMHQGIRNYNKVIVILSSGYKVKAEAFQGGVGKEYRYISSNIIREPKKYIFASFTPLSPEIIDNITPLDFMGREIIDLKKIEAEKFQYLFAKLTDAKQYNFSDIAKSTPVIEKIPIRPFTLVDK